MRGARLVLAASVSRRLRRAGHDAAHHLRDDTSNRGASRPLRVWPRQGLPHAHPLHALHDELDLLSPPVD